MRPLGVIVFLILAGAAAWLAIANRETVRFSLDAMRPGSPASSVELPLFAVLLIGALAGIVVGGAYMLTRQRALKAELRAERARTDRLQRLLADEALGKAVAAPAETPVRRLFEKHG
mgnify:CR=1 FL=1